MGAFFARRLFWATTLALIGGLAGGQIVARWPLGEPIYAYTAAFVAASVAGFVSSYWLALVPEPVMRRREHRLRFMSMLRMPFRERNFRRLIVFLASWSFATNLAAPFFAVYLIQQLGLSLGEVVVLWAVSQLANAVTLRLWGRLSDRVANKSIMGIAAPIFLGCTLAFPFTAIPEPHAFTMPMLLMIHALMGAAAGGVGLAMQNIGLKLAPPGRGTSYLAVMSLFGSLAAGSAPIVGGAFADWFATRELSFIVEWTSPATHLTATAMRMRHWEFFFLFSFLIGLYALHALRVVQEENETSERAIVQQLWLELRRSTRNFSTVAGLRAATAFPFGRPDPVESAASQERKSV
jgi:MFS family permease